MKTKIILDIKWLQEKRKTRPGKMIQTAEFLYLVAGRCSAGDRLGLKWLSLAYQERPVHNRYQLGLYFIPVKPGKLCILNMAQRPWGVVLLVHSVKVTQGNFITVVTGGTPTCH
jgi:hypothetical protein